MSVGSSFSSVVESLHALVLVPSRGVSVEIVLPSGMIISKDRFLEESFFNQTPEKHEIFDALCLLSRRLLDETPLTFICERFLSSLKGPEWFNFDQEDSRLIALFATLLYFDGSINKEELCVIHMVADAKSQSVDIEGGVRIRLLAEDEVIPYLTDTLMFPSRLSCYSIDEQAEFVTASWEKRSIIEKTIIEFQTVGSTVGNAILLKNTDFGILKKEYYELVLLPPFFTINLLQKRSPVRGSLAAENHFYMFGHTESFGKPLYEGIRIVSIASPLVSVSSIHGYSEGRLGLEMQYHDTNYHLLIDYNNPYIHLTCKVAAYFNAYRNRGLQTSPYKKSLLSIAKELVDREFNLGFLCEKPAFAFWSFLASRTAIESKDVRLGSIQLLIVQGIYKVVQENNPELLTQLPPIPYLGSETTAHQLQRIVLENS